jgi:acetolactate synthase-1/2/3 large subunit
MAFEEPNRWMTSGGLGTMGYGLPAAIGVQVAHRDALCVDIAGDASILMNIQEMSCGGAVPVAGQDVHPEQPVHGHGAPVAAIAARQSPVAFLYGILPDFVKLAEAYGGVGIRVRKARRSGRCDRGDDRTTPRPVIFDCRVAALANCFPMIPSGKAHNEMLLPDEANDEAVANAIDAKGRALV